MTSRSSVASLLLGLAPTISLTTSPFLKTLMVGMFMILDGRPEGYESATQ